MTVPYYTGLFEMIVPYYTELLKMILPHYTGLFKMIVGVLTTCHLVLQMQAHVISFCGVTSRIRFMFLLFPQVYRNWRYESLVECDNTNSPPRTKISEE